MYLFINASSKTNFSKMKNKIKIRLLSNLLDT